VSGTTEILLDKNIKNIVLFVGDAVRYGPLSRRLFDIGTSYKTVSASLHTPASFASMLTGLEVPEHGVVGFSHVLNDELVSLIDLPDYNTYFSAKTGTMHEDLHRIFRLSDNAYLSEVEEPFIWICRDPGGHAPYNGYDPETYDQLTESGPEYLNRVAGDDERIRRDYETAVNASIDRFEAAVQCVRERGIEEETLLVYASDHGELLGEYGMLGHNHVACPELVYVPTTFVHPSLESGEQEKTIRHVDLFPTLLDVLDVELSEGSRLTGESIIHSAENIGYNHFRMVFYNSPLLSDVSHEVRSCWDGSGGQVFVESSYRDALLVYFGVLLKSHKGRQIRSDRAYRTALRQFLPGHTMYGEPTFSRREAENIIQRLNDSTGTARTSSLDEATRDRLEDLGYI